MFWKVYFWAFTLSSLLLIGFNPLEDRGMNFINILFALAAIAALHALAFKDYTIPNQLWKLAFFGILIVMVISFFISNFSFTLLDVVIYLLLLPVFYAIYKLAFERKF